MNNYSLFFLQYHKPTNIHFSVQFLRFFFHLKKDLHFNLFGKGRRPFGIFSKLFRDLDDFVFFQQHCIQQLI